MCPANHGNPFFSPQVVCRPALPGDAADVLEFTKFIWEGHDYIKYVWADWLADPEGLLVVAEYGGHAVGLGKITLLSPGQWWLEGLRVDPKFQGLKIGSHIHEYLDAWWHEHGGGAIRLMTSWERVQVHHLSARMGFDKLGEVRAYAAQADETAGDAFEAVAAEDAKWALDFAAVRLPDYNGLIDWGWEFSEPDEPVLKQKAEQGRLWWWRPAQSDVPAGGLLALWEDSDEGERVMGIAFAAVERGSLRAMMEDARRLARRLGFARALWLAPALPWVESALKEAGFETDWDGTGWLYGKKEGKGI